MQYKVLKISKIMRIFVTKGEETLFVRLFQDEGYWKVISGGVFSLRYSKKKKEM